MKVLVCVGRDDGSGVWHCAACGRMSHEDCDPAGHELTDANVAAFAERYDIEESEVWERYLTSIYDGPGYDAIAAGRLARIIERLKEAQARDR